MTQSQIQTELKEIKQLVTTQVEKPMGFSETSKYLNISKSYLYKLTSLRKIPFYKPFGKKIYFSQTELNKWVFKGRQKSELELEADAENYVNGKK